MNPRLLILLLLLGAAAICGAAHRQPNIIVIFADVKGSVLEIGMKTFSEKPATPWPACIPRPRKPTSHAPSWTPPRRCVT